MKKLTLLFAMLLATAWAKAQTYDSIAHHQAGWYDLDMREDMMQLRDGNILVHVEMFNVDEDGNYMGDHGSMFYKVSRYGAAIVDSVFIADDDLNWFLLKRNPFGDDNVFAKLVRDMESQSTALRIQFFDDDLNFMPEKEVRVPVAETVFPPLRDAYMMDEKGDILFHCELQEHMLFMRVGLDGTVKVRSELPYTTFPSLTMNYISGPRMGLFETPSSKYGFWCYNQYSDSLKIVTLDDKLNVTGFLSPYELPLGILSDYGMKDRVLDWDENSFLVSTCFDIDLNLYTIQKPNGVHITRYGKGSLEAQATRCFETKPYITSGNGIIGCAAPFGLARAEDGNIYFAYNTYCMIGLPLKYGQISVVKMDPDFNIIWQRFCLEPEGYQRVGSDMVVLEGSGVAVGGIIIGAPPQFFVLVFDDEGVGLGESSPSVRPYACWPNPANDVLHFQFSPDVRPIRVELYDLQGRMVKAQGSLFGSLGLEGLPSGTYLLRVALDDGTVFTDKVVKE